MAGRKPGGKKTGGRVKGTPNKATLIAQSHALDIVQRAKDAGKTPLEIMIHNMLFAHEQATEFVEKLRGEDDVTVDQLKELMKLREVSQGCARDAAPYVHPKLASVEHKGDEKNPINMNHNVVWKVVDVAKGKSGA